MITIYTKIDNKLAQFNSNSSCPILAINEVMTLPEVNGAALVLIVDNTKLKNEKINE